MTVVLFFCFCFYCSSKFEKKFKLLGALQVLGHWKALEKHCPNETRELPSNFPKTCFVSRPLRRFKRFLIKKFRILHHSMWSDAARFASVTKVVSVILIGMFPKTDYKHTIFPAYVLSYRSPCVCFGLPHLQSKTLSFRLYLPTNLISISK